MTDAIHVATYIIAPNDPSGNPRKGYLVRKVVPGQPYGEGPSVFVEAGYEGQEALRDRFPEAVIVNSVYVTLEEWRSRSYVHGSKAGAA